VCSSDLSQGAIYAGSYGCTTTIENTIVAFSRNSVGVGCQPNYPPQLTCCDLFGNEEGDWVLFIADQYGVRGNIAADPLFCDAGSEEFTLYANSPCAPDYNPDCGLIGAWPVGCGQTAAEETSWGAIKAMFR
jgi:hypothetical protein